VDRRQSDVQNRTRHRGRWRSHHLRAESQNDFGHARSLDRTQVGYHPLEYFTKQPDKFADVPGSIKAHSTHVKGTGSFDPKTGIEIPRIQVTLATSIPADVCKRINLGYADYRTIHPQEWEHREHEGILVVHHAGEMLYRVRES
jgi:hypothetical protein